ncbi:duf-domain-containing protein [Alternaria burnsii]|uniref:Duf-domain-containing protein n=1 Tax=Alternaria burnsii TaxID=1187904 RepID=A0A8H7EC17_9PLEO|nr:duf-domain-containing protein [Alternaria burnsii]KAF7674196.1 duf-domain-containing protein [Alternaria burnsii]
MSRTVEIKSPAQLSSLLSSSRVVVVNFYNEENTSSKAIAPVYEQLAGQLTRPGQITFTKVSTVQQAQIAQSYNVTNTPTFIIYKNNQQIKKYAGSNPQQLSEAIKTLAAEAENDGKGGSSASGAGGITSGSGAWMGASLPRGYTDVTDSVDPRGLDLLNADSDFGTVKTLFETSQPSSLDKGKGASTGSEGKKDWVESDVDNQLMLYVPFMANLKVHTIQITSCVSGDEDDDEAPVRPKTIHVWTNRANNLGFEEAEDIPATQTIELKPSDWDEATQTAKLELRFVKFQNVYSLVLFVADGEGDSEKTRIDRIRFVGETGEKREIGKLEKIGQDD